MSGWAQRDAERLEDERAELESLQEQLAAKDREIAELRRSLKFVRENEVEASGDASKSGAEMLEWKARAEAAEESLRIMTSSASIWKRESEVSAGERDEARKERAELLAAILQSVKDINALVEDRDEARECVGRLYTLASAHIDQLEHDVVQPMTALRLVRMMAELDSARAALAAMPEHLRGAA